MVPLLYGQPFVCIIAIMCYGCQYIKNSKKYKMKTLILSATLLLGTLSVQAQIKNAKTEIVKVYGNCEMCEKTIETAAKVINLSQADWNETTKMATITYDASKTNVDAVLKSIAIAGYDNEKFLAPDEAYNKLPGCCKYNREKKSPSLVDAHNTEIKHDTQTSHDHGAMEQKPKTGTGINADHNMEQGEDKQEVNPLQSVLNNYFLVKDALVKSDGVTAAAKASLLLQSINSVKMETLQPDVHTIWMRVLDKLQADVQQIAKGKQVAQQRTNFVTVSNNMYALMKVAKPAETIYYQNCPMYNDGKGANWLSKENSIKNPYYGSMMLTCGETVETIQ